MRKTLLLAAALALAPTGASRAAGLGAEEFTLANGMRVVAVPLRRAPVVHHAVYYRVGAADDPVGQSGISHFLEHLMFNGTATVADGEYDRIIGRNGGRSNAYTSSDLTVYFATIARDRLETVMELEAERMNGALFTEETFEAERAVVLEERLLRTENRPESLFYEEFTAARWRAHPYGRPVIGWRHEIEALRMDQIKAFYRRHYGPGNALLVVAGDIDADELRPLAERTFGRVPAGGEPAPPRPAEPPHRAGITVEMADPRVTTARWSRNYPVDSYFSGPAREAAALDILAAVLGGEGGRLSRALVHDRKIALSAGAHFSGGLRDGGSFILHGQPAPGSDVAAVEAAVDAEIARLLGDGVEEDEVARAVYRFAAADVYSRDNISSLADLVGTSLSNGAGLADLDGYVDLVRSITPADVDDAARAMFAGPPAVTGVLRPEDGDA